jgi:hypothetical protein
MYPLDAAVECIGERRCRDRTGHQHVTGHAGIDRAGAGDRNELDRGKFGRQRRGRFGIEVVQYSDHARVKHASRWCVELRPWPIEHR